MGFMCSSVVQLCSQIDTTVCCIDRIIYTVQHMRSWPKSHVRAGHTYLTYIGIDVHLHV